MAICSTQKPVMTSVGGDDAGHQVWCHLYPPTAGPPLSRV
jgi:hypothetical protein